MIGIEAAARGSRKAGETICGGLEGWVRCVYVDGLGEGTDGETYVHPTR